MYPLFERIKSLFNEEPKNKPAFDLQSIVDEVYPGYPQPEAYLKDTMDKDDIFYMMGSLFDPSLHMWSVEEYDFLSGALDEVRAVTTDKEYQSVLQVAARTWLLCNSAHFPSLAYYIYDGDFSYTTKNIFHPQRLLGLSAYAADLSHMNLQVKYGIISTQTLQPDEHKSVVRSYTLPRSYNSNPYFPLRMEDTGQFGGRIQIQPPISLIESLLAAQEIGSGIFLKPDDWINMNYEGLNAHAQVLSEIYPTLNSQHIIEASKKLSAGSAFCNLRN